MRTALDTNVISAIWSGEPAAGAVIERLKQASTVGGLVIAAPVFIELLAHPRATRPFVDDFIRASRIDIDFDWDREIWSLAADANTTYARRRAAGIGAPSRLLPDFLIGAHAQLRADCLFTLDRKRYSTAFPDLMLLAVY